MIRVLTKILLFYLKLLVREPLVIDTFCLAFTTVGSTIVWLYMYMYTNDYKICVSVKPMKALIMNPIVNIMTNAYFLQFITSNIQRSKGNATCIHILSALPRLG